MQIRYANAETRRKMLDTLLPGLEERMVLDKSLKPNTCQVLKCVDRVVLGFRNVAEPDGSVSPMLIGEMAQNRCRRAPTNSS